MSRADGEDVFVSTSTDVATLVQQLAEAETTQLDQVANAPDAIFGQAGNATLLRVAQKRLLSSETALREAAETQTAILDALATHVALVDSSGRILAVNESWRRFADGTGLRQLQARVGENYLEICDRATGAQGQDARRAASGVRSVLAGAVAHFALEYPCDDDAAQLWSHLSVTPLRGGRLTGAVLAHTDITDRKLADMRLQRLNRLYAVLSEINAAIVRTRDRKTLFEVTCRVAVENGLLRMAMVVELDATSGRAVPLACAGHVGDYADSLDVSLESGALGRSTIGTAFACGHYDVCNDIQNDPRMAHRRSAAARNGFKASASFPLKFEQATVAVLTLLADETGYFQQDEIALMTAVASNLSHAMESLHEQAERHRDEELLRRQQALLRIGSRLGRTGAWVVEISNREVIWSDEVCAIHDMPPGSSPTVRQAMDFYAPECRPKIQQAFEACMREGTPFDLELQIVTSATRRIRVRAIGEAERNPAGDIVRIQGALQDVSQRWLELGRTRVLARRLITMLESITDAFITIDPDWRFTYVNHEAERVLQRPRSELLGRMVWDVFPEAVGSQFQLEYERAVAQQVAVAFEAVYPLDGRYFGVRAYPSAQGLAIYFQDVSEQRRARDELRVSEERFRLLSRATTDAIWDWDIAAGELWWNEGFEALFGFPRKELKPEVNSWIARIHPEDRQRVVGRFREVVDRGGTAFSDEYRFARKDGSYAYVLDRGNVIRNEAGVAIRMIGGMTDLSERHTAQEKMQQQAQLIDEARDAIIVRDCDHRVMFWSKGAERLYGWPAAEARGRPLDQLLSLDADKFAAAEQAVLLHGEWLGEFEKTTRSGEMLTVDCRWTLLRDTHGKPKSILTIDTDVTQRKVLEQQFLRAQRLESIGTLAGGIAHDLNNLLAPIMMGAGLLRTMEPNAESQKVIANIERSARRGSNLVKQVLSFASGVPAGAAVLLHLAEAVREVESIVHNTFPKNVRLDCEIAGDLWPVMGDPTQMNQILLNLCVNARDAMPDGGLLTMTAGNVVVDRQYSVMHPGMATGRYALIQVSDTGCGMAKDTLDRIFEPFYTTKQPGLGTGLGLSTVLGIVRSLGGDVHVYSEPGNGSVFKVYFPAAALGGVVAPVAVDKQGLRGNGELILVVDDEAVIRAVTEQTLTAFGYRVVTAQDGALALGQYALHRAQISLVLTDMMMPVMDGPALVVALRRIDPDLSIIAASGLGVGHYVSRAVRAGVRHFLAKPYSADEMAVLIRTVLDEKVAGQATA
jgi:PAS domain S-box-containing protein